MEMKWYNEPPIWNVEGDTIMIQSAPKTDFWRYTHYGFIRDNGHFFYQPVKGDFTVDLKIRGEYRDLYDQAGIMVRLNESNWLKCGIEFVDGVQQISAVVTREYSDWSVVPMLNNPDTLWMRVIRRGAAIEVQYSLNGIEYRMLRLAYLTLVETVNVGVMCASPDGEGFPMRLEGFKINS